VARHVPLAAAASVGMVLLGAFTVAASAAPKPSHADQAVHYLGYSFEVPHGWRVVKLGEHRRTCVRFNRHAVYLGVPPRNQSCPSSLIGTTEAMLIEPGPRHPVAYSGENEVTRRITVVARGLRIMATFDSDPAQITRILRSAGLPPPVAGETGPVADKGLPKQGEDAGWNGEPTPATAPTTLVPPLSPQVTNFRGLGFDTCAAPSEGTMRAWRKSPYRAIGIYIGGSDAACAQPNLTAGWLRHEAAAGWHFIPTYVGPQAAFGELHRSSASQGTAAAMDAVRQAQQLGFGPLTPIYYDMEGYLPSERVRALRFESAWTSTLHAFGYSSGVYSSASSGIADLAHQYGRGTYTMPDVIFIAHWNGQANTQDDVFHHGEWTPRRRVHQYRGNVTRTYGGATILVDEDYLNVHLSTPAGTPVPARAIIKPDGTHEAFYRGTDNGLWTLHMRSGKDWARAASLGGSLDSQPSTVLGPDGRTAVFYRGADGQLWRVSSGPGGWSTPRALPQAGTLGGRPWAVSDTTGVTYVFWRNFGNSTLRYVQHTPGRGWSSPRQLASGLDSAPAPVISSAGVIQVFWKGQNGDLWQLTRDHNGQWGNPAALGMGPLGGWPHTTAQRDGEAEVFWRHQGVLMGAFLAANGHWSGPSALGDETSASPPAPVSAAGLVHVLFAGSDGQLWQSVRSVAGQWLGPSPLLPGPLVTTPFPGNRPNKARIDVFWEDTGHELWWASVSPAGHASSPRALAGNMF
jgi:glycoside hydrolase-like protein